MRISDWSSDVCSSDLVTPISGPAWVGSSRSASRAMLLVGTLTTTAIVCPCALQWRSAASVSAVSPDCEMNSASPPACSTGSRRSEEHTSELQSLMRNSYAVFCLKKKKHTRKDDNH